MPNNQLDTILLQEAIEVAASIDLHDSLHTARHLMALANLILRLWESAVGSSEPHQDILAAIENAVRHCRDLDCPTSKQIDAIREALTCLAQPAVSQEEARIVRERFVDVGIGALAFLDETEDTYFTWMLKG